MTLGPRTARGLAVAALAGGRGRGVGALGDDLAVAHAGLGLLDHLLKGGGDEDDASVEADAADE